MGSTFFLVARMVECVWKLPCQCKFIASQQVVEVVTCVSHCSNSSLCTADKQAEQLGASFNELINSSDHDLEQPDYL